MKKLFALFIALIMLISMYAYAGVEREVEWPITTEDITIKVMGPKNSMHCDWEDMDLWQFLTKETGLKFEFNTPESGASFSEKVGLAFASGNMPDMFIGANFSAADVVKYGVEQNMLVRLDEYLEYAPHFAAELEKYPDVYASIVAEDGHIYAFPTLDLQIWTATRRHMFINKNWLEAVNMEAPETIDEFHEMLTAFKEYDDINGDGIVGNEVPLGSTSDLTCIRSGILGAYGLLTDSFEIDRATKEVVYAPITENFKAYLETMHEFWEEGLLDKDMFSLDQTTMKARAAENTYGAFDWLAAFTMAPGSMVDDFIMIKPLTSELNDEPLQFYNGAITVGEGAISASSEHIVECMQLFDWMYTKEGNLSMNYGPNNYAFSEDGAHYFVLADGTGGTDNAYRYTRTVVLGPYDRRACEESYGKSYLDKVNNYNNSVLYTQVMEYAIPYIWNPQPSVVWTADEAAAITGITDMQNYVATMEAKFITGDADIDNEWDTYVANVKSYGYDAIYAAYESAWTRFLDGMN